MEKPTLEQVEYIFSKIVESGKNECSFRYLIYDLLGFDSDAYLPLYEAGGMTINNALLEYFHPEYKEINNEL